MLGCTPTVNLNITGKFIVEVSNIPGDFETMFCFYLMSDVSLVIFYLGVSINSGLVNDFRLREWMGS